MDRARNRGRLAEAGGGAGRVHARGIPAKQRVHLAALLIAVFIASAAGAQDISFDPEITRQEFAQFSRLVGQAIYATPVEPARARGLLGFDIGVAVTAIPVDTAASYWQHAVGEEDFTISDYAAVPRVVASKGLSVLTVSASWAKVQDTDIQIWGGSLDVPIISGGLVKPTLALRGAYAQLRGVDEYDLDSYGLELFLSKGFGPITPYVAAGLQRTDAAGRITPDFTLEDESTVNRYTAGVRISLLLPKIVVEATQAEERSYSAKISFGL